MRRRGRAHVVTARTAPAVLAALAPIGVLAAMHASCTFPDVSFVDDGAGDARAPDARSDSSTGNPDDGGTRSDSRALDATVRDDATAKVPDGSCLAGDCDCDKDTFPRGGCDAGMPVSAFDCDDLDPLRRPGAGYSSAVPDEGQLPKGDWDCDGTVTKAYRTKLTCGALLACPPGEGFTTDPGCGEVADYFECRDLGLNGGCTPVKLDARPQLCR